MGVHRKKIIKRNYIKKYVFLEKNAHIKKLIHMKNHLNEMIHTAGGYRIGFSQFSSKGKNASLMETEHIAGGY